MLVMALTALALAHTASLCDSLPSGMGATANPIIAGKQVTICLAPLPGPEPRTFEWDIGGDGTVDATTTSPQLDVASPAPPTLVVVVRYPTSVGNVGVISERAEWPVQEAPAAPPPTPRTPASIRVENDTLVYRGSPDTRDLVSFNTDTTPYSWFAAGGNVEPGPGCTRGTNEAGEFVSCPATHNVDAQLGDHGKNLWQQAQGDNWTFQSVKVTGGANGDAIYASGPQATTIVDGGPGGDTVVTTGTAIGGDGNDKVTSGWKAIGGDGNDVLIGSRLIDAGPGDDTVRVRATHKTTVLMGPGNDVFNGYGTGPVLVYGGDGNDLFRVRLACNCGLFGEAGSDTFHTITSLLTEQRLRGQLVVGGPGRDTGLIDGVDCTRSVERVTIMRRTGSDGRYRCKTPSARLRP